MVFNKYDALKTETLLRVVQEQVRQLKDKKRKPKKTKAFIEAMKEHREMQYTLIKRFKEMDRKQAIFFPLNSWIEYRNVQDIFKVINEIGQVTGHNLEENKVLIKLEKDPNVIIKVDPIKLKLLYIREYYI